MVWKCQNCSTEIEEESFEVCWHCGCEKGQSKPVEPQQSQLKCLRCDVSMTLVGSKAFHEGTRWGVLGNIGELLVDKEALEMFVCKSCGKVEFFLPGYNESVKRSV